MGRPNTDTIGRRVRVGLDTILRREVQRVWRAADVRDVQYAVRAAAAGWAEDAHLITGQAPEAEPKALVATHPPQLVPAVVVVGPNYAPVPAFLTARTIAAPSAGVTNKELYAVYRAWALAQQQEPFSVITFGREMRRHGLTSEAGGGNILRWPGLELRPGAEGEGRHAG